MISDESRIPEQAHPGGPPNGDRAGDPASSATGETHLQREELYRALVERAGEGIWLTDEAGTILEANESAGRSLGYLREELLGRPIGEFFHPDDLARRTELLARLRTGETIVAERRARRKDGSEIVLEGTARLLESGRVLTISHDVTERRKMEQDLRQSEARLRLIADAMPALISYVDTEERYRFNNRGYDAWFGIHPALLEGQTLREALGEAAYERIQPYVAAALTGQRVAYEAHLPYREGGARHVAADYVPDVDEDGRVQGFYALVTDISDQKQAEEALRQADRAKDEFLAILAHELRNPLAPIVTAAQVIKLRNPQDPAIRRQAEIIERQSRHLARMVDDLLDISRVTAGKVQLRIEKVALAPLLEQAVSSTRTLFEERRHTLSVRVADAPLIVEADPTRMVQVVVNLLNNAAKYTPPGGEVTLSAEIETPTDHPVPQSHRPPEDPASSTAEHLSLHRSRVRATPPPPGHVVLRVRDTGVGLSPELMPQLFELFVQGERSLARTDGGLGVGLALVKRLVEMHQGTIAASSEGPGRGSEFTIRLPLAR